MTNVAKLILNPQMPSRKEIDLPRAGLSIGRDPGNDIVIPDALVSRRHARIIFDGREYLFYDCESSNGSLLNGDRVSERKLTDGDVLWLGASRLLFRAPETAGGDTSLAKVIQHPSSHRLRCPNCDQSIQAGDIFCRQCGGTLEGEQAVAACASCGSRVVGPARFCNACGDALPKASERSQSIKRRMERVQASASGSINKAVVAAPLEKRLLAALIDLLAAAALFSLFSLPAIAAVLNFGQGTMALPLMILPVLSFPAYFAGFWAARRATPGKELLGLVIVMKDPTRVFGVREALKRFAGFCLSLATLGLGFMMILIDGDTLHDGLAGTRVVERRA